MTSQEIERAISLAFIKVIGIDPLYNQITKNVKRVIASYLPEGYISPNELWEQNARKVFKHD